MPLNLDFNNSIIIAPYAEKQYFLYLKNDNPYISFKFFSKEELLKSLYGDFNDDCIKLLMHEFNLTYKKAREECSYLQKGICNYDKYDIYLNYLKTKKAIVYDSYFLNLFFNKNIYVFSYSKDDLELNRFFEKISLKTLYFYKFEDILISESKPKIYKFKGDDEEIKYAINLSLDLLNSNKKVKIVCSKEKMSYFESYSKLANIKFSSENNESLMSCKLAKEILKEIEKDENFDVKTYLDNLNSSYKNDYFYLKICETLNYFDFYNLKNKRINFIQLLENEKIEKETFDNEIPLISSPEFNPNYNYILLDFTEKKYGKIKEDNDSILDIDKPKYGLTDSNCINYEYSDIYRSFLKFDKLVSISYNSLSGYSLSYYVYLTNLIKNKDDIKFYNETYAYKNNLLEFFYESYRYNLKRYNQNSNLLLTYSSYFNNKTRDKYDNNFKKIDDYIYEDRRYSYSFLKSYFECPFKFYCTNVLKLSTFESSYYSERGNLGHRIMENVYNLNLSFDEIKNKVFDEYKDKFLKEELILVDLDIEQFRNVFESTRELFKHQKIYLDKSECESEYNAEFDGIKVYGRIDSIRYLKNDYFYIVDYKTGGERFAISGVESGKSLQLPAYLFLVTNDKTENHKIENIMGAYIQPLICDKRISSYTSENYKMEGITFDDPNLIYSVLDDTTDIGNIKTSNYFNLKSKKGKAKQEISHEKFRYLIDAFKEWLKVFDYCYKKGDFGIRYAKDACSYCDFDSICYKKDNNKFDVEELKKFKNQILEDMK